MQVEETLAEGVAVLNPLMKRHGFDFVVGWSGKGSGGWSAFGEFRREQGAETRRRLELHLRYSLGLVTYHIEGASLSHSDYMRALKAKNQYPGFSDDPLDGFRHLLHDLERFATDFLEGPGNEFARCLQEAERLKSLPGFKRLAG